MPVTEPHPPNLDELRTEGKIAADKGLRIGWYCIEAADEIERLRAALRRLLDWNEGIAAGRGNHYPREHADVARAALKE